MLVIYLYCSSGSIGVTPVHTVTSAVALQYKRIAVVLMARGEPDLTQERASARFWRSSFQCCTPSENCALHYGIAGCCRCPQSSNFLNAVNRYNLADLLRLCGYNDLIEAARDIEITSIETEWSNVTPDATSLLNHPPCNSQACV